MTTIHGRRIGTAALIVGLTANGCFFPARVDRAGHQAAYVIDGVIAAGGLALLVAAAAEKHDPNNDLDSLDRGVAAGEGAAIIAAGGVGALVNVWLRDPPQETPAPPPSERHADPARVALMRSWSPPIVDGTAPEVIRLDGLARAAAAWGDCGVAIDLIDRIEAAAPAYYAAAVAPDPLLALCPGW
jgi:hypothetical protein